MLTSHFCFLSVPSVDSFFSPLHPCVCRCVGLGVMCFVFVLRLFFVYNTLDAFAPSPGDGPAAVAAGPAADAFGGSGG